MKAMIFGAAGQVGQALVATAPAGCEVIALTRGQLDIVDADAVAAAIAAARPDLVLNAAAYTAVDKAESDTAAAQAINADAAGGIARASAAAGAKLVHISTDFVFDGSASSPYPPDAAIAPLGVYGATKADGEAQVMAAAPDALIVRTAWVYAAGGRNFVETMLRVMAKGGTVRVVADQVGTPTHALSLARALWALAPEASGIHHYTDAGVASWYDFAVAIEELGHATGQLDADVDIVPIATADYPTPARRPSYSVLDKTSAWALLGPARHWRVELAAMITARRTAE